MSTIYQTDGSGDTVVYGQFFDMLVNVPGEYFDRCVIPFRAVLVGQEWEYQLFGLTGRFSPVFPYNLPGEVIEEYDYFYWFPTGIYGFRSFEFKTFFA